LPADRFCCSLLNFLGATIGALTTLPHRQIQLRVLDLILDRRNNLLAQRK